MQRLTKSKAPAPGLSRRDLCGSRHGASERMPYLRNLPRLLAFEPGYPCGNKLNGTFLGVVPGLRFPFQKFAQYRVVPRWHN